MEAWLSVSDVAELMGLSERAVRKQVDRGILIAKDESSRYGRGGKVWKIALTSLDPTAQHRWMTQHSSQPSDAPPSRSDTALALVQIQERFGDEALAQLTKRTETARQILALRGSERVASIKQAAADYGVSERTIHRWVKQCESEGAVVDGNLTKEGTGSGGRKLPPEAIKYIEGLYLDLKRPTGIFCLKKYNAVAADLGWPTVSRATFFRILSDIPPTIVNMGRRGEGRWRHSDMPKCKRTRAGMLRNEEWALDHKRMDFWADFNGRPIRPWLSGTVDWASGCLVGWAFAVRPSGQSISESFASAVYPKEGFPFQGLPLRVYMDNGKDYKSVRISGKEEDIRVTVGPAVKNWMTLTNIEGHYAIGESPWAKGVIERVFGCLADFQREQVAYCGISPDTRPEYVTPAWVKKQCDAGKLVKMQDLPAVFGEWYRKHITEPSEAFGGRSRLEVYTNLSPARLDMPTDEVGALLFGKGGTAKVTKTGINKFGDEFWFFADELVPYIGKTVSIRYATNRIGELFVWDSKGRFICRVANRELLRMGAAEDDVKEWMRTQAHARKVIREEVLTRRQTVADIAAQRAVGSPSVVTLPPVAAPRSKVITLTNLEQAAKARTSPTSGQAGPAGPVARSLADELLMSYASNSKASEGSR